MKIMNIQGIICLVIIFLFANQAWAAEWIHYMSNASGNSYYDKSSIKKVNKNISSVWTKVIFNKDGKTKAFSFLKSIKKAEFLLQVFIIKKVMLFFRFRKMFMVNGRRLFQSHLLKRLIIKFVVLAMLPRQKRNSFFEFKLPGKAKFVY